MDKLQKYFDRLWANYISMTPQALAIKELFENNGETIVNDHIALRTFNHPKVNIIKLATYFTKYGYVKKGEYKFEEKKLFAIHLEHQNPLMPKVFISELLLEEFCNFDIIILFRKTMLFGGFDRNTGKKPSCIKVITGL